MTPRSYADSIQDMLEAMEDIRDFIQGQNQEAFSKDRKTINAVVRSLGVIGEAAKRIPEELRREHADIPFRYMAGASDKLIHDYTNVDLGMVWNMITVELPPLEQPLRQLLQNLDN